METMWAPVLRLVVSEVSGFCQPAEGAVLQEEEEEVCREVRDQGNGRMRTPPADSMIC